jgi:hypothetical protein
VAAFAPLLKAQKNFIREIPKKTFTYGAKERHQVFRYSNEPALVEIDRSYI